MACFTSVPLKTVEKGENSKDEKAFICSIDNKFKTKSKNSNVAVEHYKNTMLGFGKVNVSEFYIGDKANE